MVKLRYYHYQQYQGLLDLTFYKIRRYIGTIDASTGFILLLI